MPNDIIAQGRVTKENQRLFINSTEIPGVQNTQLNYQINATPLKHLGLSGIQYIPRGPQVGNVSISTLLISDDQFLQYTGNVGFNGYVVRSKSNTTNNFSFTSGYLTSYSSRCAIGQIPQIEANISVLGNIGQLSSSESAAVSTDLTNIAASNSNLLLKIADPGSINIDLGDFNTNRCISYDLNINVPRNPIYIQGQQAPIKVETNWPIEVNCNFTAEVDDYTPKTLNDFPESPKKRNITITLKDLDTAANIVNYGFSGMQLIGENYSSNNDGPVTMSLNYQGFINRK